MPGDAIDVTPLHPGRQSALDMARRAAGFIGDARRSLDLALYDVRLPGEPGDLVAGALRDAAGRGVAVRIAYNADHDERVFPPPPHTKPELIEALPFPTRGIPGIPDLMHHKYVVRDGGSVWTGSTNWTTDSWTLQENVIVLTHAPAVAAEYARNFEELWSSGDVDRSGHEEPRTMDVEGRQARAWFTPGHGEELSHRIARAIGRARERIRIASPVITAGPVLGTLAQVAAEAEVDLRGVVDRTQMEQVVYSPETPHDFMHAKVTVADDWIFAGSFNLSRSGERNAENVLELQDPELADQLASYIDEVRGRYDAMPVPGDGRPT